MRYGSELHCPAEVHLQRLSFYLEVERIYDLSINFARPSITRSFQLSVNKVAYNFSHDPG